MSADAGLDLEILAAQLRRHTEDLSLYGGMLLAALSAALPAYLHQLRRRYPAGGDRAAHLGRRSAVQPYRRPGAVVPGPGW